MDRIIALTLPPSVLDHDKPKNDVVDVTSTGWLVAMSQCHFAKVMTSFLTKNASHLDLDDENC